MSYFTCKYFDIFAHFSDILCCSYIRWDLLFVKFKSLQNGKKCYNYQYTVPTIQHSFMYIIKLMYAYMYMYSGTSHTSEVCSSMLNLCRKLPPNTRESSGVNTAWIQPIHVHVLRGILSLK